MEGNARTWFTPKQRAELWSDARAVNVWRTSPERLRGGTRAAFIGCGQSMAAFPLATPKSSKSTEA